MGKQAIIKWNANQLESIKRDLLIFDSFHYDPELFKLNCDLIKNVSDLIGKDFKIIERLETSIDYLKKQNILKEFQISDLNSNGVFVDKSINKKDYLDLLKSINEYYSSKASFIEKYHETVKLLKNDYRSGFLKYIGLLDDFSNFGDHHIRLSSAVLKNSNLNLSTIPIVENLNNIKEGKETQVIKLVIENLPIPKETMSFQDVIDFKNDSDNRRRYYGLINWINKIQKTELSINEIEDELKYYTLEFENKLKIEKTDYKLSNLEVIISLPFQIAEHTIKVNWSKIPKTLFQFKRNKLKLLKAESDAFGKEMAYIVYSNKKFKN